MLKLRYEKTSPRRLRSARFARDERGTQLVELAISLPVLLMLFAATAEFGRYMHSYVTLAKATRSAARFLASTPVDKNRVSLDKDDDAQRMVVYGDPNPSDGVRQPLLKGLTTGNVRITRDGGVGGVPATVKVEIVNYKYTPLFKLGDAAGDKSWMSVPVKPSTTMRYLLTQPSI
ncbi:MAG TPA: TadE family protein [Pyrinomonadaceae bacterium]|jgi:Flp pilus assembly protein TadG